MATITYTAASTKASNASRLRIMAAGECKVEFTSGKIRVPCPCTRGIFEINLTADPLAKCSECDHSLEDHEDAVSSKQQVEKDTESPLHRRIVDDMNFCPRQDTVTKLIDLIDLYPIIHVRGTPASGKTTLARILRDCLKDQGRLVYFLNTWEGHLSKVDPEYSWDALYTVLRQRYPDLSPSNLPDKDVVMILDEAQGSYDDPDFWNDIIKSISDNPLKYKLRIILFCSFGSPSTGVEKSNRYTPVNIPRRQRITLTPQSDEESPQIGLFYTESEFNDVLSRIVRHEFPNLVVNIDDEAKRYVFSFTNGHPGGVTETIRFLCNNYRASMKSDKIFIISKQRVIDILDGKEELYFKFLENSGASRCFPRAEGLKIAIRDILCEIAERGNIIWNQTLELENCYRNGWVHRMIGGNNYDEIAVLPSRLHEKWIQHLIGKDRKALPPHFTNLTQLCMKTLSEFSTMNLRHSTAGKNLSTAAQPKPMEAQYQDEFYRAFNKVAGRGVPISTEWARTISGRVDFFIPEKKWAIELLRDYNQVDNHIKRFKEGGQYFQWLETKAVNDWIIINCTTTAPTAVYNESRLFHAVFQRDFTGLQIFNHKRESLCDVLCLTN
ncbi:hypothetical protein BDV26DRAFT_261958 [Aspergillus bertholletiae]|uniref:Uncharacterized protein n=1 Tax=Aspergillus bertholletiae TaxID=1226010 RepID=A0A5N7B8W5_9EURO|nr:hypothetical protein BDV26DRAFT_261958 [Aspergillus bertholletiae]